MASIPSRPSGIFTGLGSTLRDHALLWRIYGANGRAHSTQRSVYGNIHFHMTRIYGRMPPPYSVTGEMADWARLLLTPSRHAPISRVERSAREGKPDKRIPRRPIDLLSNASEHRALCSHLSGRKPYFPHPTAQTALSAR